jgi:HSP20 family molecular chaperone IbpA
MADISELTGGDAFGSRSRPPGLKPGEVIIQATSGSLTVSTEPQQAKPESGRRYIQREQSIRPLSRLFEFPVEIDTDHVRHD